MTDDYWPAVVAVMVLVFITMGIRFAFPPLKAACGVAVTLLVLVVVFLPGVPLWMRISALAISAASGGVFAWRRFGPPPFGV